MGIHSHYSTQKTRPFKSPKHQFHIILDYQSLNKSIKATHNGNSVISYYSLPNITDLLPRLRKKHHILLI